MKHQNNNTQQGFNLVEVMVALAIGVFLTAGASQIFLSTNKSNRMQDNLSRMQENARFAMHFISEDIRKADYWGGQCVEQVLGSLANHLDASDANYDPAVHEFNIGTLTGAISGTNGVESALNSSLDAPDTITLKGFFDGGSGIKIEQPMPAVSADLKVTQNSGIEQHDIVLVSDCRFGDVFEVTHINISGGNDNLVHNSGAVSDGPGNTENTLQKQYDTTAQVYNLSGNKSQTYTVAADTNGVLGLTRNGDQVVADIENIQILYGRRQGGEMAFTTYYAPASSLTATQMDEVVSVRVSLLVVSPDDNLTSAPRSYDYNGGTTPADRRLRKIYTSTVTVRNRLK